MTRDHRKTAEFRFYEELNDFLLPARRKSVIPVHLQGTPAVKDAVEAIGVPHTEIELIVVNGESVGWDYRLRDRDRVAVYPVFESVDVSPAVRLRDAPLRRTRFVVDVHLGKLARLLRMLGFDTAYGGITATRRSFEHPWWRARIVLTRDRGILKTKRVTHGYWVRSSRPEEQLQEVLDRFDLARGAKPFSQMRGLQRSAEDGRQAGTFWSGFLKGRRRTTKSSTPAPIAERSTGKAPTTSA